MKGFFMTRTGNVVNVETVETSPANDNPQDHPTACTHFGLSRLKRLQQADDSAAPAGLAIWVLKFDGRQMTLSQAISSRSVKLQIEGTAVYGL